MYVHCIQRGRPLRYGVRPQRHLYSAAAVTSVAVAVNVATTAAASDTASPKSKMIKFPLLYNGVKRAYLGASGAR